MRHHCRLALLICLVFDKLAAAIPKLLLARQSCDSDSWICPDWDGLWGILEGVSHYILPSPQDSGDQTPPTTDDGQIYPGDPESGNREQPSRTPPLEPAIEINVLGSPDRQQCDVSSGSEFVSGTTNLRPCKTQQIIWAQECDNMRANGVIGGILSGMNPDYLISKDPFCPVKEGTLFWLAMLSPQEIEALQRQTLAIRTIFPNVEYKFGPLSSRGTKLPTGPESFSPKLKRATARVNKATVNDPSLSFLSTPAGKKISGIYSSFTSAGRGIDVYIIDTGLDKSFAADFRYVRYMYAINTEPSQSDYSSDKSGTFHAQKIGSALYGVAPEASLTIVKTAPDIASFLNALVQVIASLLYDQETGMLNKGRKVVSLRGGLYTVLPGSDLDTVAVTHLRRCMEWLLQDGAVIVLSATSETIQGYPYLLSLPNSYGPALDIVTVGSVRASWQITQNGTPLDLLPPTSGTKVYAPGNGLVRIAGSEVPDNVEGDFISTGIAAGLVAYFLSLPDLGTSFKNQHNVPGGVLWFLQNRVSVERIKGQKALWNGLDSENGVNEFENWYGPAETRPDGRSGNKVRGLKKISMKKKVVVPFSGERVDDSHINPFKGLTVPTRKLTSK